MAFEQIRLNRTLSRLELGIAVILIGTCAAWLIHRFAYLEAAAEARALQLTARNFRTGIMIFVASRLLDGNTAAIATLADSNPVGVVIEPPPGYIGALRNANPDNIRPGQWYFDEDGRFLVYHVVNVAYLDQADDTPIRARFRMRLNFDDRNHNGKYDPGIDAPKGLSLDELDKLKWKF